MHQNPIFRSHKPALLMFASLLFMMAGTASAKTFQQDDFLTQAVGHGAYEMAVDDAHHNLFVATAPSVLDGKVNGIVYWLDTKTLAMKGNTLTRDRAFATALDSENHILYVGNTRENTITVMDTRNGAELALITTGKKKQTKDKDGNKIKDHKTPIVREIALDKQRHRLYATGVGEDGVLWVIDTTSNKLIDSITTVGKNPTGIALDLPGGKIYLVNGDGEFITMDANDYHIISQVKPDPEKKHFFLNLAVDSKNHRAFLTDNTMPNVLVVNIKDGKLIQQIATPDSMGALFNPLRHEVYITHRNDKQISIIDSNTLKVKDTINTKILPNSLAISADGNTLYVSLKQPKDVRETEQDYILKVDLKKM